MFDPHWIPGHRGNLNGVSERDIFASWGPGIIKIITTDDTVPYLEDVPPNALILVRNHPLSEDGNRGSQADASVVSDWVSRHPATISTHGRPYSLPLFDPTPERDLAKGQKYQGLADAETPYARGTRHAGLCNVIARYCESKGVSRARLIFEGLNEMQLWASEPPWWSAEYSLGFLRGLHSYALRGSYASLGVGWPGNGGIADAPPDWSWFQPVINEFEQGDYLGLHEYWALAGPQQNWRWWAGRFLQCPFRVPILITEAGIDLGVANQPYGGWQMLPGDERARAKRYAAELLWYAQQCAADGRVQGIFPFTWDYGSNHWQYMNIRNQAFLDEFMALKPQWSKLVGGAPIPVTPPPPVVTPPPDVDLLVRQAIWNAAEIDFNPEAALARYARDNGLGNPVTQETDAGGYRAQGFAKKIVYCQVGQWDRVSELDW